MNNLEKLLADYQNNDEVQLLRVFDPMCDREHCPVFEFCTSNPAKSCSETRATWLLAEYVEPDSWEKVRADAEKVFIDYWGCEGFSCDHCPAEVDGLMPDFRLKTDSCDAAQAVDILHRIRALNRASNVAEGASCGF